MKKKQVLLLEDVDGLGRSGDVAFAKMGYIRNFLIARKKAIIADKHTLQMQAALKEARQKKAVSDRAEAEELSSKIRGFTLTKEVKIDPEGNMYGSVTTLDIVNMMGEKGFVLERKNVLLSQALRTLGSHKIDLKLKEAVAASFTLEIVPEGGILPKKDE